MKPSEVKHTPGPWEWAADWSIIDEAGTVDYADGENPLIEKYMDLSLRNAGAPIIPIRIDHHEMIYDGEPISPANRKLIAAAPDLVAACKRSIAALAANGAPNCEAVKECRAALQKAGAAL